MASMYMVPGSARWSPLGFCLHGKQAFASIPAPQVGLCSTRSKGVWQLRKQADFSTLSNHRGSQERVSKKKFADFRNRICTLEYKLARKRRLLLPLRLVYLHATPYRVQSSKTAELPCAVVLLGTLRRYKIPVLNKRRGLTPATFCSSQTFYKRRSWD